MGGVSTAKFVEFDGHGSFPVWSQPHYHPARLQSSVATLTSRSMLRIDDLTFRMQGRLLLDATTVHVPMGARVGFVGRNGTGKTTLFKLITGEYAAESGSLELRRGVTIGQVAQEAPGTDISLLETVLAADTERTNLLAEAETAKDPTRIADIHTRLADIEAHSAEARAGAILHGLGV